MKKNSTKKNIIKNLVIINPENDFLIVEIKDFGQYDHLLKAYDKKLVNGVFNYFHEQAKIYFTGEVLENLLFKENKTPYSKIDMIVVLERDKTHRLSYDLAKEGINKEKFSQTMDMWGLKNIIVEETKDKRVLESIIVKESNKYQNIQKFEISNKKHNSLIYLNIVVNKNFKVY